MHMEFVIDTSLLTVISSVNVAPLYGTVKYIMCDYLHLLYLLSVSAEFAIIRQSISSIKLL